MRITWSLMDSTVPAIAPRRTVRLVEGQHDERRVVEDRLSVVVAHPADDTFGCGSVLAHAAELGIRSTVACATRGEAGSPAPGRGLDDADMAEVREIELHAAAEHLGVAQVGRRAQRATARQPTPGTVIPSRPRCSPTLRAPSMHDRHE